LEKYKYRFIKNNNEILQSRLNLYVNRLKIEVKKVFRVNK